jgi:hypothetical protein
MEVVLGCYLVHYLVSWYGRSFAVCVESVRIRTLLALYSLVMFSRTRTRLFFFHRSIILASAVTAVSSVGSLKSIIPIAFGFSSLGSSTRYCLFRRSNSIFSGNNLIVKFGYFTNRMSSRGSGSQTKRFVTERSGDGTITVSPQNEADQSALVVICHGLGDTAEGFADVAEV